MNKNQSFLSGLNDFFQVIGGVGSLTWQSLRSLRRPPYYFRLILEQIVVVGVNSSLLLFFTGLATGSVMALQFGYGLEKFGGKLYIPKISSISIIREMGPVFASLMVAGRVGAGMAAEIGSMKVTQQIDAIRALGTSPIKRIVIPRVAALIISLPLLTIFVDFIAIGSALLVSTSLGIGPHFFIQKAVEGITFNDFITGTTKTPVFAYLITILACYRGLNTAGGTRGVGDSTTWVVVYASVSIMIADFFITKFFIEITKLGFL